MTWTDDEIEDLYKKALESQHIPYKEEYWTEMESLLDAQKKDKRKGFGWIKYLSGLLLFILGIGYYFFVPQKNMPDTQQTTKKERIKTVHVQQKENKANKKEAKTKSTHTDISDKEIKKVLSDTIIVHKVQNDIEHTAETIDSLLMRGASSDMVEFSDQKTVFLPISSLYFKPIPLFSNLAELGLTSEQVNDPQFRNNMTWYTGAFVGLGTSYLSHSDQQYTFWGLKMGGDYRYTDHFSIGMDLGFRRQQHTDLITQKEEIYYGLGEIRHSQKISYNRLQFIDLRLRTNYILGNMQIGIHLSPSYLLGVKAEQEQKQQISGKMVAESNSYFYDADRSYVRTNNLKSFGLDFGLSLRYDLPANTSLELGTTWRANKIIATKLFDDENRTFPLRVELGIIKRFKI